MLVIETLERQLMIEIEELELHDALIKSVTTECVAETVLLKLEYYPKDSRSRQPISILFSNVELVSKIMNMERLGRNAFAGNVNYWVPEQNGLSYIYLSDGCVMIKAGPISIVQGG